MHLRAFTVALAAILAGCSVTPDYRRPDLPMQQQWQAADPRAATATAAADPQWWRQFGSAELDELMRLALAGNQDLAAAMARIVQARANARAAGADLLPSADLSASAGEERRDGARSQADQVGVGVAYEIDLWGGRAASAEAAEARYAASLYDREAVALVLQAEVANTYFQTLALQDRLRFAGQNLAAARRVLQLVEVRAREGAAAGLELAQQRTAVLNIQAQIPGLEQQLSASRNALAVLLGRPPQGLTLAGEGLAGLRLPTVNPGQPPQLLERRPDIRRSEARLIAANADIGAARSALYPSARLSASAGISGLLGGGGVTLASVASSLAQTIFDGGRSRAQVRGSEAQREELAANYVQTVLTGLQEAQDSLVAVRVSETRLSLLREAAVQAREAYRLAQVRYEAGAEDLLTLLDSQRTQLLAEDAVVQAELTRYTATTGLFKALGGGWDSTLEAGSLQAEADAAR